MGRPSLRARKWVYMIQAAPPATTRKATMMKNAPRPEMCAIVRELEIKERYLLRCWRCRRREGEKQFDE